MQFVLLPSAVRLLAGEHGAKTASKPARPS